MSTGQRGAEITIRLSVDKERQEGSITKILEFTATPRDELKEEDFLGEQTSEIDYMNHGWDLKFSVREQDSTVLDFITEIQDREENREKHPQITLTVYYAYRDPAVPNKQEVYYNVFLRVAERGFAGRKEYVIGQFEGKCRRRSVIVAAA